MTSGHCRFWIIVVFLVAMGGFAVGCGDDDGANQNNNVVGDDGASAECGDGVTQGLEECDDGEENSDTRADACRTTCELPACGDGVTDDGEACDDGPQSSDIVPDACRSDCAAPSCGDDVVDVVTGETCDDGNLVAGDYCSPVCQIEVCGNGSLDVGEVCDDGGLAPGDGCSPDCRSDETCGNGYPDFFNGEQCDDSNHRSHDGCSSGCTGEFPIWTKFAEPLGALANHVMVYDSFRDRLVLFGGSGFCGPFCNLTFEHDGLRWHLASPATVPDARRRAMMAYDVQRGVVVLFGGEQIGYLNDTWEYDGTDWSQVTTANVPSPRSLAAMTYDANRQRVVLFGGETDSGDSNETWEYDGTNWTLRAPTTSPGARAQMQAVYDSQRQVVVMVGGLDSGGGGAETWEYNGNTWSLVLTTTNAWTRTWSAMAYDASRGVTLLFSGFNGNTVCGDSLCDDVWEYNGTDWSLASGVGPVARRSHALAYHSGLGKVVLMGGSTNTNAVLDDTWTWDGSQWESLSAGQRPLPRNRHAIVYDTARRTLVMFGGDEGGSDTAMGDGTWVFEEEGWRHLTCSDTLGCPAARSGHVMVWDSVRERVVLFGGGFDDSGIYTAFDDTWEFDGAAWTETTPTPSPPSRTMFAMAFDPVRGQTVLFGGQPLSDPGGVVFDDTWEYDGSDWVQMSPVHSPPARGVHNMAWDGSNQEIVMMGGLDDQLSGLTDTWTYDGIDWSQKNPTQAPSARGWAVLVYDPLRGRTLLFGGVTLTGYLGDTWEWDGSEWSQVFANPPAGRGFAAGAYHAGFNQVAVHGGFAGVPLDDLYFFQYGSQWPEEVCDSGQDVDQDGDIDCADPDCEGRTCAADMHCAGSVCVAN